ncbi:MAG: NAD(P)/FAD-dependent oxidoreductase [Candidatus Jordarchaeum sp.]|uniref:NAD(P)/FAD-dependent oxidoreductase n=1 Tax=Candidatus Jordarchaeum sp. TaxID=2823881 RepID=UPI004048FD16
MKIVIIGFSLASFTAIRYILNNAPETEVEVYTDEEYAYYPRPRLYEVLSDESSPEKIVMYPIKWYEDNGVKVHLGKSVKSIITENNEIILQNGERVQYDKLLLANGARSFVPPIKGVDKKGVFALRTIDDALTIKEYANDKESAVVIGGGLLGLEISVALKKLGLNVTILEFAPWLLPRQIDNEGSDLLIGEFEKRGVEIKCGAQTDEIIGNAEVSGVRIKSGETIPAELVICATGIRSNIELPQEAGIKVNRGVLVDEHLRTNIENIYAAGDIAEHNGRVYGIIPATTEQAQIAAANMIGKESTYNGTVAMNSLKVVGIDLTSIGLVNPETEEYEQIRKIDADKCQYKKIVVKDDKVVGSIIIGERKSVKPISDIIKEGVNVEKIKHELLKEDFDLKKLAESK